MIKSIFCKLFSEPASKQNEIELRNAIIAELYAHLEHIGHPVEAVRVPLFAIPAADASSVHDAASVVVGLEHVFETEYGGFRLFAGLDAFGNNVVTGRTASATATSSTLEGRLAEAAEWLGLGEPWTGEVAATCRDAERDFGRPSPALSPTWAEASRAYDGLDRAAPIGIGTHEGAPALARAHLAAKLHDAGLAAERAAEARGKGQM